MESIESSMKDGYADNRGMMFKIGNEFGDARFDLGIGSGEVST